MPLPAWAVGVVGIVQAMRPILLAFGGMAMLGAISNIIGGITGQNPMAQISSTMMQTMVPMIVTMMPVVMVMSMMTNMIQGMVTPFTQLTAPMRSIGMVAT